MRKFIIFALTAILGLSFAAFQGCDWEDTGSSSYNTSRGAGITVNFSGFYKPKSGTFLVTSNITYLLITQIGNSLEVRDNNNSLYTGSVGAPGIQASPHFETGTYPAGAEMLQAQMSFGGLNALTGLEAQFVGVIHAVAVNSVYGTRSSTDTSVNTTDSFNLDVSDTSTPGTTVTIGSSSNDAMNVQNGVTTTFGITEANTQYLLDGNWVEGGGVSAIHAIAPGTQSTF